MDSSIDISIIVPAYNQADHIESVLSEYLVGLRRLNKKFELIVVPNNCRDATEAVCLRLAESNPELKVFSTPIGGWGHAVRFGLERARGELICYTNLARTKLEELLLMLVYAQVMPGSVVKANRKIRDNIKRRIGSLIYNLECRTLFDLSNWDVNGTPKIFPRECSKLFQLKEDGDLIDAEFCLICRRENYPMIEVPIFSTKRHGGRSTTKFGSAFKMYFGALRLWKNLRDGRSNQST